MKKVSILFAVALSCVMMNTAMAASTQKAAPIDAEQALVAIVPEQDAAIDDQIVTAPAQDVVTGEEIVVQPEQDAAMGEEIVVQPEQDAAMGDQIVVQPEQDVVTGEEIVVQPEQDAAIDEDMTVSIEENEIPLAAAQSREITVKHILVITDGEVESVSTITVTDGDILSAEALTCLTDENSDIFEMTTAPQDITIDQATSEIIIYYGVK